MKTTKRFEQAFEKLYNAFNNGTLDAMNCEHCAVGNLCDNDDSWIEGSSDITLTGTAHRIERFAFNNKTGYSRKELAEIESTFLYGVPNPHKSIPLFKNTISNNRVKCGFKTKQEQRELQFKGLIAVLNYLAELDGIESIDSQYKMFEDVLNNKLTEV